MDAITGWAPARGNKCKQLVMSPIRPKPITLDIQSTSGLLSRMGRMGPGRCALVHLRPRAARRLAKVRDYRDQYQHRILRLRSICSFRYRLGTDPDLESSKAAPHSRLQDWRKLPRRQECLCHWPGKLLKIRCGTGILACVSAPFKPFSATY